MVAVPTATPVTSPVIEFTIAIKAFEEVQVPPESVFVKIDVEPIHALGVPPIAERTGNG